VEHLVFKGTKNHTAASLARLVDRVGGDLNAWTDREEMAFTCTVPAEAWPTAVDALCELCFFPTFPPEEFEREKEVIRNEILSSLEDPEELSYDSFLLRTGGEWGRAVAGTESSLASITLEDAREWWRRFGGTERLTVSVSGGVDPALIEAALSQRLAGFPANEPAAVPAPTFAPRLQRWRQKADFQMVQVIAGFALPVPSTAREAAVWQIFSMLWGETMSSRLFQSIRERRGLCYSVTSQLFDTETAWSLQVFASCAPENAAELVAVLEEEIARLKSEPPSAEEWEDARSALRGGAVLGAERTENRSGRLWRQYQAFGTIHAFDDHLRLLDQPVGIDEARPFLEALTAPFSLLVWGRLPRGLRLIGEVP
jgi:predicted Zn-dependent peptidase